MIDKHKNRHIDVVILCGGLGKRLRPLIKDRPKPMAEINHKPFLDLLLKHIVSYGFKRFILCVGYMNHIIKDYYKNKQNYIGISYSPEKKPLGTGGALKKAKHLIKSKTFLVMNGDSFCPVNLSKFINFHRVKKAMVSVVLTKAKQDKNTGKIKLNKDRKIVKFVEKSVSKDFKYSNVGIYLMQKSVFQLMAAKRKFSLEYDFFSKLIDRDFYGYTTKEDLVDIGTPKEYRRAQKLFFS